MSQRHLNYFSFVDLIVYIVIFFFSNLIGGGILHLFIMHYGASFGLENMVKIAYIPSFLILIIVAKIYRRIRCVLSVSPCRFVGNGRFSSNAVLFGILMMVAVSVVTDPLISMFPREMTRYVDTFTSGNMWVTIVVTVMIAPILEEVFFRGILLKDMSVSWGPRWAIFVSSLLFSLFHFNIIQAIPAFLMGLVMGFIYIYTRRGLTTVIVLHMINNLISSVSLFWGFGTESVWQKYLPEGWISKLVYFVAAVLILLLMTRIVTLGKGSSLIKKLKLKEKL